MKHLYLLLPAQLRGRPIVALLFGIFGFIHTYGQCSVSLGADTAFCQGDSIVLDAGPGFVNYVWSNGHSGQTLTVKNPGMYAVLAADGVSCAARDTVFIDVNPLPHIELGPDSTICDRDFLLLDPGAGYAHYQWSTGDTTALLFAIITDEYKVVVTDSNGCSQRDSMFLTANPTPVVNLGNDTSICFGSSLTLDAGADMAAYSWSTGEQTQTITANGNMVYRVEVENSYGCKTSDSIELTINLLPQLYIGPDQNICANQLAEFEATLNMAAYAWSTGDTGYAIRTNTVGLVSVTITDDNGCRQSDTAEVTVKPIPAIDLGPDHIICKGDSVTLDAGADMAAYSWNTGAATQTIVVSDTGTYAAMVSDTTLCYNTDTVFVDMYPFMPVMLGNDTGICSGSTIMLDAGNGFVSYVWSTTAQTQQITVNAQGEYRVVARDVNDCLSRDTIKINVKSLPDASFTHTLQGNRTVDFEASNSAAVSYDWDFGDSQAGSGRSVLHTYNADGAYNAVLTVNDGECSDTAIHQVEVTSLGIASTKANRFNIQAYPNPSAGIIQIVVPVGKAAVLQVQLADMAGRIYPVTSQQAAAGSWTYTLDTRSLGIPAGIYLLRVNMEDNGSSTIQIAITE